MKKGVQTLGLLKVLDLAGCRNLGEHCPRPEGSLYYWSSTQMGWTYFEGPDYHDPHPAVKSQVLGEMLEPQRRT